MERNLFLLGILLVVTATCAVPSQTPANSSPPTLFTQARIYQTEDFRFTIPQGWRTKEEVWQRPMNTGQDFHGLGVQEIVTIQYPGAQGKGKKFFSISSSPRIEGEELEKRAARVYENAVPEVENLTRQTISLAELSGIVATYERPWGEPWWEFHDIWLEHDDQVYVLSSHTYKNSYQKSADIFDEIVESFEFIE